MDPDTQQQIADLRREAELKKQEAQKVAAETVAGVERQVREDSDRIRQEAVAREVATKKAEGIRQRVVANYLSIPPVTII